LFTLDVLNILIDRFDIYPNLSYSQEICEVEIVVVIEIVIEPAVILTLAWMTIDALHIVPIIGTKLPVLSFTIFEYVSYPLILLYEDIIIVLVILGIILAEVVCDVDFEFKVNQRISFVNYTRS